MPARGEQGQLMIDKSGIRVFEEKKDNILGKDIRTNCKEWRPELRAQVDKEEQGEV